MTAGVGSKGEIGTELIMGADYGDGGGAGGVGVEVREGTSIRDLGSGVGICRLHWSGLPR